MTGKGELLHTFCMWNIFSNKEFQLISLARRTSLCTGEALVTLLQNVQTFSYIPNIFLPWCSCPGELEITSTVSPTPPNEEAPGVHKRQDLVWNSGNHISLPVASLLSCEQARITRSFTLESPRNFWKVYTKKNLRVRFLCCSLESNGDIA